jgi:hypothetical protein
MIAPDWVIALVVFGGPVGYGLFLACSYVSDSVMRAFERRADEREADSLQNRIDRQEKELGIGEE